MKIEPKKLWIDKDRTDGTPFLSFDNPSAEGDTYIVIDKKRENFKRVKCIVCGIVIVNGWENIDHYQQSYCSNHIEIMN